MDKKKIKVNNNSGIGYSGKIKYKILDGKKIVTNNSIKNNGKWPLFLFFAQCLTGKYANAESQRPVYIQLFNASDLDQDKLFTPDSTWTARTLPIRVSTSPAIDYISNPGSGQIEMAKGTLKFSIPFSMINNTEEINLLVLRSEANIDSDDEKNVCAYVIIDPKENPSGLIDEQIANKLKYTLFLEWSLSIQDQATVKIN